MHPLIFSLMLSLIITLAGCEQQHQPAPPQTPPSPVTAEIQPLLAQCNQCHDHLDDRSPPAPFLRGQQRDYLAQALRRYRNGERRHEQMNSATKSLSDPQIDALAEHYANDTAQWRGFGMGMPEASSAPGTTLIANGKTLAPSCAACHGAQGISRRAGVPSLAGLDNAYLNKALGEYVTGTRNNELMVVYKTTLKTPDIQALAAYYGTLPARRTTATVEGRPADAQTRRNCSGCHGADGNPLIPGMPRLAGQDEAYLTIALTHYRERRRTNDAMVAAAAKLSDTAIKRLAAYYAAQPPRTITAGKIMLGDTFDPLGDGALLANGCDGCHASGEPGIPNLHALAPAYLQHAMTAYQNNQRAHSDMRRFVSPFNALDLEKISLHYATQPPANTNAPDIAEDASSTELANGCNACHGPQGNSANAAIPTLAGQDATYLRRALIAYANGERHHDDMTKAASALTPEHIQTLADHYARQQRHELTVRLPQPPEIIAAKCNRCHGDNGVSEQPDKPRLAGQVEAYLIRVLQQYQRGERNHSAMHAMADMLSPLELHAIAAFYAQQQ